MINIQNERISTCIGQIDLITMKSDDMEVILTSYGAAIYSIKVFGHLVTIAPEEINDFLTSPYYYGKTLGRTSGRLVLPNFKIDNTSYDISAYRGDNVKLHGGPTGFSFRNFKITDNSSGEDEGRVTLFYKSMHMEEQFPGELDVTITYVLTKNMELRIVYEADSDHDTLCNLTNHTYFNLSSKRKDILIHDLKITANQYVEVDKNIITVGKKNVKDTLFDFNTKTNLFSNMQLMDETPFKGYDHTWIFNNQSRTVELDEVSSPVKLVVDTSYPSVVIYTHNHYYPLNNDKFKQSWKHSSLTLECQYEPGGVHYSYLNSAILRRNEHYEHFISYQFITKD